jgi:hypothetical protein
MNIASKLLRRAGAAINKYFFEDRYTAHPMVCLRIGVALILLLQMILLRHDILAMLQPDGIIKQELVVNQQPAYYPSSYNLVKWLTVHFPLSAAGALRMLLVTYTVLTGLVLVGLLTRISALLLWLLHLSFLTSGYYFSYGIDYFLNILLFYLVLFPVQHEYALDKYLFRLRPVNYTPYVRVLQLHLCLVYCISGLAKAFGSTWWNGIAILKAVVRPGESTVSSTAGLAGYEWLFVLAGAGTVLLEICYPVLIHIRKTRKICLYCTYAMHLFIAIVLDLPLFAATMVLFNIAAFYFPTREAMQTAGSRRPLIPVLANRRLS